ncbi:MAG TPA: hypothetical protein VK472_03660 [Allosphingosinicella sp.]|nr:hypothetical protein [Allosphingosinicella sp.]
MSDAPDRFETIAWVYSQTELAVLLSLLKNEDIYVLAIGRGHVSVQWGITLALGGVEIRVHPADAAGARALLAGIDRTPSRRGVFCEDRLLDILILLILFFLGCFAVPSRLPATFVPEPRKAERRLSP